MKIKICDICHREVTLTNHCSLKVPDNYFSSDGTAWYAKRKLDICKDCLDQMVNLIRSKMKENKNEV